MYPGFNSFPHHRPNQVPGNPSSQQVIASNPSAGNAANVLPNVMQMQPQMGISPQNVVALNGLLSQLSNAPNQLIALQNQLAMQQLMGFSSQNNAQALNAVPGQFFNMGHGANPLNMFQQLTGNPVFPNLQFCAPNAMQNVNQLLAMQMPNSSQVPHYNGPPCPNQTMGSDLRQQFNQSQQCFVSSAMGSNGFRPLAVTSQQLQESHATTVNPHINQANGSPQFPPRENRNSKGAGNTSNSNFRNFPRKEFKRNPRTEGFQKSYFQQMKNGKRTFDYADGHGGKDSNYEKAQNYGHHNPTNQANERKRVSITYTEQEIQRWREERRKNHPANRKKKQMESKIGETDAKVRREQLKEILAKQAELGVEVAEIPLHYLAESENKGPRREENRRPFAKRERFQNKFDKKRKHNQRGRFTKKQRSDETGSPRVPPSLKKREPTLLQKLLSRDVKRDKLRLLQVFRFMVMNSFFKDGPEQPLKFPSVIVNENGTEGSVFEKKSAEIPEVDFEAGSEKISAEILADGFDEAGDSIGVDNGDREEGGGYQSDKDRLNVHDDDEEEEEEEGEITD